MRKKVKLPKSVLEKCTELSFELNFLKKNSCVNCKLFKKHEQEYFTRGTTIDQTNELCMQIKEKNTAHSIEFKNRMSVLKQLGYFDIANDNLPLVKARIAREIGMLDNVLYITEVFIENVLQDLEPEEIAALLSLFVC